MGLSAWTDFPQHDLTVLHILLAPLWCVSLVVNKNFFPLLALIKFSLCGRWVGLCVLS